MPFSNGKKRGVFSPLHGRIAPRSVRLDALLCRSLRPSYFLETGTAQKYCFPTLASPPIPNILPPITPIYLFHNSSNISEYTSSPTSSRTSSSTAILFSRVIGILLINCKRLHLGIFPFCFIYFTASSGSK